jgi:hypothetical protein
MDSIRFVWWNLQNFFDTTPSEISRDLDYTPEKGWTTDAYRAKKQNLAQALAATHGGQGPELLAVCEIEWDSLLEDLITEMGMAAHLKVVKDPSGTSDLRGIDVAIAYDNRKLRWRRRRSHLVYLRYRTRDIFEVEFEVKATGERLVVFACHWPSRRLGKYRTDPLRAAVAEHLAFLVEGHVKAPTDEYLKLKAASNLKPVHEAWEKKVLILGDLNDEPYDRSLMEHLHASPDLELVTGLGNDMPKFYDHVADYRAQEVFLHNPMWRFLPREQSGSYFLASLPSGEKVARRYAVLDQVVASRGLVSGAGLTLDANALNIFRDPLVATPSGRPRPFDRKTGKGTSDHLPVEGRLTFGA